MTKKHNLSYYWKLILVKLAEYPDGVNQETFITVISDDVGAIKVRSILDQMWFSDHHYYDTLANDIIQISREGNEAINEV